MVPNAKEERAAIPGRLLGNGQHHYDGSYTRQKELSMDNFGMDNLWIIWISCSMDNLCICVLVCVGGVVYAIVLLCVYLVYSCMLS